MSHDMGPEEEMPEDELEDGLEDDVDDVDDDAESDGQEEDRYEREPDPPEIGDTVDGRVLVCRGDDVPDQFMGWLEWIVDDYNRLERVAGRHRSLYSDIDFNAGLVSFLEEHGVSVDSSHWEGACISGIFQEGYVEKDNIKEVERRMTEALAEAEKMFRDAFLAELQQKFSQTVEDMDIEELSSLSKLESLNVVKELEALRTEISALRADNEEMKKIFSLRAKRKDS